ncbi:CYTH and CHAD domain-containing protein [Frankia sp. AgB1.9]|uniref:CYTH and CHAD domain-containing protein n=1 Tax=unclassified Frankia TaxID=2632575 RepID=UPI001931C7D1|nr:MULTISPECIES: CYTH and CHAD domain-containing protein [unclassified Frankia]MBL7490547.1 CYTH and CHAD domain-containing protein [Frankia sp. AgW1.1]MBL7553475.1 CYTH and CHAD domain-containing protein [Frankia sp. AgB1.9]MBL7622326.1 CYTH and CHAD domain-containing protein [Frankia sp. AgB1.8]
MATSAQRHREVETKFDVDSTFVVPTMIGLAGVASAVGPTEEHLDAVYYDTDDLRLARHRITLRRREGGHDAGWHLKLRSSGGGRDEISRPLGAVERDPSAEGTVPGELADIVAATTRGKPLAPVAWVQTVRRATTLRGPESRNLAEVADDEVHARTLGSSTASSRWREIEVEALGDDLDVLSAAGGALRSAGARPAAASSKLARTLGTSATRPELPTDDDLGARTTGEIVRAYLVEHTRALLAADARVRLGDPESVHDLRVAARRLRSTLRTFQGLFDPAPALALQARLRELNLLLNAARDGEVQLDRFMAAIGALDDRDVRGPVAARVQGHLGSEHLRGRERALAWMRGPDYLDFVNDLVAFVAIPPYSPLGTRPAGQALRAPVRKADRRLRRRVDLALRTPEGDGQDAALHAARKAAKRLRYAAEAVTPVHGKDAARHARRGKKIQDALGEHQDCVVAQGVLREFATAANAAGESSFTYGVLLGGEQEAARLTRDAFAARWPKLARRGDRRWLR